MVHVCDFVVVVVAAAVVVVVVVVSRPNIGECDLFVSMMQIRDMFLSGEIGERVVFVCLCFFFPSFAETITCRLVMISQYPTISHK